MRLAARRRFARARPPRETPRAPRPLAAPSPHPAATAPAGSRDRFFPRRTSDASTRSQARRRSSAAARRSCRNPAVPPARCAACRAGSIARSYFCFADRASWSRRRPACAPPSTSNLPARRSSPRRIRPYRLRRFSSQVRVPRRRSRARVLARSALRQLALTPRPPAPSISAVSLACERPQHSVLEPASGLCPQPMRTETKLILSVALFVSARQRQRLFRNAL